MNISRLRPNYLATSPEAADKRSVHVSRTIPGTPTELARAVLARPQTDEIGVTYKRNKKPIIPSKFERRDTIDINVGKRICGIVFKGTVFGEVTEASEGHVAGRLVLDRWALPIRPEAASLDAVHNPEDNTTTITVNILNLARNGLLGRVIPDIALVETAKAVRDEVGKTLDELAELGQPVQHEPVHLAS